MKPCGRDQSSHTALWKPDRPNFTVTYCKVWMWTSLDFFFFYSRVHRFTWLQWRFSRQPRLTWRIVFRGERRSCWWNVLCNPMRVMSATCLWPTYQPQRSLSSQVPLCERCVLVHFLTLSNSRLRMSVWKMKKEEDRVKFNFNLCWAENSPERKLNLEAFSDWTNRQ